MAEDQIRVVGLNDFARNLKRLDTALPKALRLAGNEAADIVVKDARPRVPVGPGKGGHASSSIKAASTRTATRVQEGGNKFPYMPWLDFGGKVGRKHHTVRPFLKTGRYVWKSYADNRERVIEKLQDGLVQVARSAGIEVEDG